MSDVFNRASIRRYKKEQVQDEKIRKILEAAMCAPSAGNEQPWHFIVCRDEQVIKALSESSPYSKMAKDAPLCIVVCGDLSLQRHEGYWVLDCSAAVENMLIEVSALGLGAVWLGIYPVQERVDYVRRQFNLPENVIPFALIPIGYPAEDRKPASRFNESRVRYDKW